MLAYKGELLDTPSNYTKRFPGMTLPEAFKANKTRKSPFPALRKVTINDKWLPRLHSILKWCVNNAVIDDNPATGVKVDVARGGGERTRIPFTPGDLTKIFAPPLFHPSKFLDERHWSLLIALFTGMRASEIAQVKLDSVRHERGILVFAIEEETKNRGSVRLTPVHNTLLALGIEERVKTLRLAGKARLFPEWFARGQGLLATALTSGRTINQPYAQIHPRWFNRTYLPSIGIEDRRKVFHCFRHTLKTALSRAGVARSLSDEITGHDDQSSGGSYIHETSIDMLKDAIEKIHFDGLELSAFAPTHAVTASTA